MSHFVEYVNGIEVIKKLNQDKSLMQNIKIK